MGDLAAEEVEFAGIVVHDRISLEAGDLAAIHIECAACVDFDGVVAVVLQIVLRALRDDLAGGLAAVGEGESPVAGDADAGFIVVGVNNELVAVEAEADVGDRLAQRPSIVDGNVVEQIVVAAGLDGGEAVDTRPRGVGSVIMVAVGGGAGVVAGAVGVGVGGLQIQTAAIGHQRAAGAVTGENVGVRGAVHDLLCGDKIRIHADTGGGGQLVIAVADIDVRIFCCFTDVEVAGGLAVALGVAGDVQGAAHGAGGYAAKVHAAALDAGSVVFNGAAGKSKFNVVFTGAGHVPVCTGVDGAATFPSGVILHGAAADGDLGRCIADIQCAAHTGLIVFHAGSSAHGKCSGAVTIAAAQIHGTAFIRAVFAVLDHGAVFQDHFAIFPSRDSGRCGRRGIAAAVQSDVPQGQRCVGGMIFTVAISLLALQIEQSTLEAFGAHQLAVGICTGDDDVLVPIFIPGHGAVSGAGGSDIQGLGDLDGAAHSDLNRVVIREIFDGAFELIKARHIVVRPGPYRGGDQAQSHHQNQQYACDPFFHDYLLLAAY